MSPNITLIDLVTFCTEMNLIEYADNVTDIYSLLHEVHMHGYAEGVREMEDEL